MARTEGPQQTRKRPGSATAPRPPQELPLLQGQGGGGRLQEPEPAPALHLGEGGRSATAASPAPAGATSGRWRSRSAGARDGAPALRGGPAMEVILLTDVDKVGLRGDVVNVARGYARNYLLPRKLAEPATAGRVAELKRIDEQRLARGLHARAGERDRRRAAQDGAHVRRQVRADRRAVRLRHDHGHRGRALAHAGRSGSTGRRSAPTGSAGSAATRSRSRCSRTSPQR